MNRFGGEVGKRSRKQSTEDPLDVFGIINTQESRSPEDFEPRWSPSEVFERDLERETEANSEKMENRIKESPAESLKKVSDRRVDDVRNRASDTDSRGIGYNSLESPNSARKHHSGENMEINKLTPSSQSSYKEQQKHANLEKLITLYSLNPGEKDDSLKKSFEYSSMKLFVVKVLASFDVGNSDHRCSLRSSSYGLCIRLETTPQPRPIRCECL